MSFTGQVLNVIDTDLFNSILAQIDPGMLISGSGSPIGTVNASRPIFYCDTSANQLYFCYVPGTPATWVAVNFTIVPATTGQAGIVVLATQAEVLAGTNNTAAVTPYAAAVLAQNGINSDITELLGLATPLSQVQGGTGVASFLTALKAALPTFSSGLALFNDGTNLLWQAPGADQILLVNSNITLSPETFHVIEANGLTLTLPSGIVGTHFGIGFTPGLSVGPNINTTSGQLIMGAAAPLVCDVTGVSFWLEYTGSTYGFWVTSGT
jgi:hypothetical protein